MILVGDSVLNIAKCEIDDFFKKFRFDETYVPIQDCVDVTVGNLSSFFDKLSMIYDSALKKGDMFNVFDVLSPKEDEVKNCKILRWILDCNGSHGLGQRLSNALLRKLNIEGINLDKIYRCSTEVCPLGNQENRVDIVLTSDEFVIYVEVKINANEGEEQISRYVKSISTHGMGKRQAVIFLTKTGYYPKSTDGSYDRIYPISWKQLSDVFLDELEGIDSIPVHFIRCFCNHILNF